MKKSIKTRHHNFIVVYFLILPIMIIGLSGIIACSESTPSVSEGKAALIAEFNQQPIRGSRVSDCLKVISFDKTNGIAGEIYGTKIYTIEFKAQVEIIGSRCVGTYDTQNKSFISVVVNEQPPGWPLTVTAFKLGSKYEHNGRITVEKTEQGWLFDKDLN